MKKVTLKNIKSVETSHGYYYSASVFIDGKKTGEVENMGDGGPDCYTSPELESALNEIVASLPEYIAIDGKLHKHNAETYIGLLIDQHFAVKRLQKLLKSQVVFTRKHNEGCDIRVSKKFPADRLAGILKTSEAYLKEQLQADDILNLMPFEKAVEIYLSAVAA